MKRLAVAVLLVAVLSGCGASAPAPPCDGLGGFPDWNYRAERAYLDSTYLAHRDSLLTARFNKGEK